MAGLMTVLLATANINFQKVPELEAINCDFANTDKVLVVGANVLTNQQPQELIEAARWRACS